MPIVHLRLPKDIDNRIQRLVDEGLYGTKTDVIKTALIEWLKEREMRSHRE